MASHMDLIRKEIPSDSLRASANAISAAVAVAGSDLIVAKAGLFSKKLKRYALDGIKSVRFTPNPHADLLALEFKDATELTLMFNPESRKDAETLAGVLQSGMNGA